MKVCESFPAVWEFPCTTAVFRHEMEAEHAYKVEIYRRLAVLGDVFIIPQGNCVLFRGSYFPVFLHGVAYQFRAVASDRCGPVFNGRVDEQLVDGQCPHIKFVKVPARPASYFDAQAAILSDT
jgi:hypothetical protein